MAGFLFSFVNMRVSPDHITELKENEIFVFGSNLIGKHGKGAALTAKQKFGAIEGIGEGLQGQSYGIPTKYHPKDICPLSMIFFHVDKFVMFARDNPKLKFLVTEIGCGYAKYKPEDIAPLFKQAMKHKKTNNIYLPQSFLNIVNESI